MNKLKIAVIVLAVLAVLGTVSWLILRQHTRNTIMDGPGMINENADAAVYHTDNLIAVTDWLGKTTKEAGIDDSYIQEDKGDISIELEGLLFGEVAHGSAHFLYSYSGDEVRKIDTVYLYSHALTYDACKEQLTALYGEAEYESENPYVESLGGAVTTCRFVTDNYQILLSVASEHDYISLTVSENK